MSVRIGVDTGGTFTDVVSHDAATGATHLLKTPSTPDDPGRAIINGLVEGRDRGHWRLEAIEMIVHGTTVATNALLERRGARTALVTTRGFRDVLQIQRQNRPEMYSLRSRRPEPLVPRELRFELTERLLPDGGVETPVDERGLDGLCERLARRDLGAVVVGFLHSHANPGHEQAVGRVLRDRLPGVAVCLSSEIDCQPGEFERLSTACANGYVQPVVEGYLERLRDGLEQIGVTAPVFVMKSSGGAGLASSVARRCVETALSGPAGGVRACVALSSQTPGGNVIAADMGGTSFDVAVVSGGRPRLAREASVGGLPIRTAMLDIHTIGAGGGSIAWVDAGGALRVGPESAGAAPGPACYGRGGRLPTVTDANLVLGRLSPDATLGGGLRLDPAEAAAAVRRRLAEPLRLSVEAASLGVLRVANAAMVAALRKLTVERGVDPREYTLCGFGGAGPLHAAELADELGAARVIIPAAAGVFSAHGLLLSDLREDRYAACRRPLDADAGPVIERTAKRLEEEAAAELAVASAAGELRLARAAASLRYRGQTADLPIEWPPNRRPDIDRLAIDFHAEHRQRFGFDRPDQPIELVGVAVSAEVTLPHADAAVGGADAKRPASPTRRPVWFGESPIETLVVQRQEIQSTEPLPGPAIIQQDDTTIVVPPGWVTHPIATGDLLLHREKNARPPSGA